MSSPLHTPPSRRVRLEYAVIDGQLRGTVGLSDGRMLAFASAAELERCLELNPPRLVLVDDTRGAQSGDDGLAPLSPTERAIARQALAGDSNREIADALFYSVKSVEAYLTRVYRRLGIAGRSDLPIVSEALEDLEPRDEEAQRVAGGSTGGTRTPVGTRTAVVELLIF
jgi:DNA-binding CsgD family transcriptional regulator